MNEQGEPPAACKGSFRRRLRGLAGALPAVAGALVAGALFWATYRRFVKPGRQDERPDDRPHSARSG
jgi:hypothetical protein